MAHELVVALHVTDDATYAQYRAAMAPIPPRTEAVSATTS
jgi:hypothetical protein